jgi:putative SOS response-associated peptidase YedK
MKEHHARWLDPDVKQVKELESLFAPLPDKALTMNAVAPRVNSPRVDDASCIEPISDEPPPNAATLWEE